MKAQEKQPQKEASNKQKTKEQTKQPTKEQNTFKTFKMDTIERKIKEKIFTCEKKIVLGKNEVTKIKTGKKFIINVIE